jgi:hypothetical protein
MYGSCKTIIPSQKGVGGAGVTTITGGPNFRARSVMRGQKEVNEIF